MVSAPLASGFFELVGDVFFFLSIDETCCWKAILCPYVLSPQQPLNSIIATFFFIVIII